MAKEGAVTCQLTVRKGKLNYMSSPTATFQFDVSTAKGPSPGMVVVPTTGRDIYFSELTTPGECFFMNLDDINYVEVGIYDPQTKLFYPFMELGPGQGRSIPLTRNLGEQYSGSGTGTTTPENYLRIKANGASCNVIVDAFEK